MDTPSEIPANVPPDAEQASAGDLPANHHVLRRGWRWWTCYLLAWTITLALVVVAALRIFYHDGTYFLTQINAFTRYAYLPVYPCLAWAAWHRRWGLALAGCAVAFCHLTWLAPNFVRDRRFDTQTASSTSTRPATPSVRIFFANVLRTNREFDAMFQEIAAADADVVLLAEWGSRWNAAFNRSALGPQYVYGLSARKPESGSVNIFSRVPLFDETRNWVAGRLVRAADIRLGSQKLRLVALHAPRPLHLPNYHYDAYWKQILSQLKSEPWPLVVIGDFNATEHSLVYKQLQAAGLRSAHDDRGRGYATTWPNDEYWWFPPIRIDHVFLSPDVECLRVVEGRGKGSDHTPVIVDLRLRDGAPDRP